MSAQQILMREGEEKGYKMGMHDLKNLLESCSSTKLMAPVFGSIHLDYRDRNALIMIRGSRLSEVSQEKRNCTSHLPRLCLTTDRPGLSSQRAGSASLCLPGHLARFGGHTGTAGEIFQHLLWSCHGCLHALCLDFVPLEIFIWIYLQTGMVLQLPSESFQEHLNPLEFIYYSNSVRKGKL